MAEPTVEVLVTEPIDDSDPVAEALEVNSQSRVDALLERVTRLEERHTSDNSSSEASLAAAEAAVTAAEAASERARQAEQVAANTALERSLAEEAEVKPPPAETSEVTQEEVPVELPPKPSHWMNKKLGRKHR